LGMMVRRAIENLSLFVLIGLVALRPLIGESYDPAGNTLTEALAVVSDPRPLTTLVFDVLILCAACGWLIVRAMGSPRPYRWTGLEWGAAIVAIAGVLSCIFAGDKRPAINATIDWLCLPLLTILLVQLLREPWQRRLLLAAVLASACVSAAQCIDQYYSFNETWAHYQEIKSDFWARQGVELDSSRVELFEQRMKAREATGFLPQSNVTGAYLVLCLFGGLGLMVTQWRNLNPSGNVLIAILCNVGTALMLVGVALTKSLGAVLSCLAGLVLWFVARRFASWIDAHRARTWLIAWMCVVAGAGAVVGYGWSRGSLPGWSLTFRWQYWQASSELIAEHWTTGVGRENFGGHYLGYKSIESPEEVANPHNLFVQAAADWGLLGFVGILLMILQASFRLVTRCAQGPIDPTLTGVGSAARSPPVDNASRWKMMAWTLGLLLVVTIGRMPLLGSANTDFLYYSTVTTGIVWLLGFVVYMSGASARADLRSESGAGAGGSGTGSLHRCRGSDCTVARTDPQSESGAVARGTPVGTAVAVGLFAFLVHDMINFAMFVPGSATTFFALLGLCRAERSDEPAEAESNVAVSPARRWLPVMAGVGTLVFVNWIGLIPVARAQSQLRLAHHAAGTPLSGSIREHPAFRSFVSASASDPFDSTAEIGRAEWLAGLVTMTSKLRMNAMREAVEALTTAMDRDPFNAGIPRMRAKLHLDLAQITGADDEYLSAVEDARRALELYPSNPAGVVLFADMQAAASEALASEKLIREAIFNYERALQLDDQRLSWETLHRMRQREKEAIAERIQELRERVAKP